MVGAGQGAAKEGFPESPPPPVVDVTAGLAPNEKEGVRDGVKAAVVAAAIPLLPNAGVAAMLTAGSALNVKAGVESGLLLAVVAAVLPKAKEATWVTAVVRGTEPVMGTAGATESSEWKFIRLICCLDFMWSDLSWTVYVVTLHI